MALHSDDVAPHAAEHTGSHTASSQQRGGSNEATHVVTAYVVEPGSPCNRYRWDAATSALVLESVLHPASPRGVDLARIPLLPLSHQTQDDAPRRRASWIEPLFDDPREELLAGLGPSLLALVLAQPPNPPGTRLSVRLLGSVRGAPPEANVPIHADTLDDLSDWVVVTVPAADPSFSHVERVSDLSDEQRLRLERALADIAPAVASFFEHSAVWMTADQAMAGYREARARGRLSARAAEEAARGQTRECLFSTTNAESGDEAFRRRLARDAAPAIQEPSSAWREIAPISLAELRARGTAVFGEANHLIRWIPTRFARYLGDLLLPEEHVLFFAECPPLTFRGWSGTADHLMAALSSSERQGNRHPAAQSLRQALRRLRSHHLQSGILIITDRQVLLLRDYAAPDAMMVQWGYVAHSWPLGRLVAACALTPGIALDANALVSWPLSVHDRLVGIVPYDEAAAPDQHARLVVALEGATGIQLTGAAFPPDMHPVLERAADLLHDFLPWPGAAGSGDGDRRVRLVPAIVPWKPTDQEAAELATLGGLVAPELAEALDTATAEALRSGETVLAQARTPRTSDAQPDEAALLTVTPERLLIAKGHGTGHAAAGASRVVSPTLHALPLSSLTATTLQHSLLGCAISISLPDEESVTVQRLVIGFPSPLIVPFRALFTRLRLLTGGPPKG